MVSFFSTWAEQLIIAIVVTSIIEIILPENNNKKYIKMVIGIYILFTIIAPVINKKDLLKLDELSLESFSYTNNSLIVSEAVNQTSMDERIQELYLQELEKNIKVIVENEGYEVISCKVDGILYGNQENQGIKRIDLVISRKSVESQENSGELENKSNIKSINKVEINLGLNKILGGNIVSKVDTKNQELNSEISGLKEKLSSYYEVESKKINITFK